MNLPRKAARPKRKLHPIQPPWLLSPLEATAADPERQTVEYRRLVSECSRLAGGRCEAGMDGCEGRGIDPHHIFPCGEGGAAIVPLCWLRLVCRHCHETIHNAAGRADAEERGLIVPRQPKLTT